MRSLILSLVAMGLLALPLAAQEKPASDSAEPKRSEPFTFADFTWMNGNCRQKESLLDSKYFTGEFRLDAGYVYSFNHPRDHTLVGASEAGRTQELQVNHVGLGGDFHYEQVHARLMVQFGMYSQITPRNDFSTSRGQGNLSDAYRYITEASAGYHWDVWDGINLDAGIFTSYVGLMSGYDFDNWVYHPSYVSANTPWFFNGARLQMYPNEKMKVELWLVNGWQSYGMFNSMPGVGGQFLWRPNGSFSFITNNYWGKDTLANTDRERIHSDSSIQVKYLDRPDGFLDKAAFTVTMDAGRETGGGVSASGKDPGRPKQYFLGFMVYNRFWFNHDREAFTVGVGNMTNPGRYLVILPPINGATANSGTPYFTTDPGDAFRAWDYSLTYDYMPSNYLTWRAEFNRRGASVPYFAGPGGVTPPGGNTGPAGSVVAGWAPDLRKTESRVNLAMLVKF